MKLVALADSKSAALRACRFESDHAHHKNLYLRIVSAKIKSIFYWKKQQKINPEIQILALDETKMMRENTMAEELEPYKTLYLEVNDNDVRTWEVLPTANYVSINKPKNNNSFEIVLDENGEIGISYIPIDIKNKKVPAQVEILRENGEKFTIESMTPIQVYTKFILCRVNPSHSKFCKGETTFRYRVVDDIST